jgi:hypothetical protein
MSQMLPKAFQRSSMALAPIRLRWAYLGPGRCLVDKNQLVKPLAHVRLPGRVSRCFAPLQS